MSRMNNQHHFWPFVKQMSSQQQTPIGYSLESGSPSNGAFVPQTQGPKFSSAFSVNSLLGNSSPANFGPQPGNNANPTANFASILTLATAMANYRMQQNLQSAFHQQQQQPPPHKRARLDQQYMNSSFDTSPESSSDHSSHNVGGAANLNSSVSSISSPTSSSSTTTSSSISLDYMPVEYYQRHMAMSTANTSSSVSSASSISLNESEFAAGGGGVSASNQAHSPVETGKQLSNMQIASSESVFKSSTTPIYIGSGVSKRKRHLSVELNNPGCPICGIVFNNNNNGLNDLRAHLTYEIEKVIRDDQEQQQITRRQQQQQSLDADDLTNNCRYVKYLQVKESRQNRLISKKSKLRHRASIKENLTTDNINKSANKRVADECSTTGSDSSLSSSSCKKRMNNGKDDYLRDEASTVRKSYDENDDMYESVMGDDDDGPINSTTSSPIVELDSERTSSKCPNCLEPYKSAMVSSLCWHVSCNDCWTRSLNEHGTCPHCNLKTRSRDLKKIFI